MLPLIIAHRGASSEAPENTLKAFELAIKQGADGIELDIFLTRDRKVVVTHDENLERLTGVPIQTRKANLAELKALDFGEGESIPTLDEVFDLTEKKLKIINVEIKSTGFFSDGIEKELIRVIRRFRIEKKIRVSSFNPFNLLRFKHHAPDIDTGLLVDPGHWYMQLPFWVEFCRVKSIHLEHTWCTEERYRKYHQMENPLWMWTVNQKPDMKKWIRPGVEALITNFPARLRHLLTERKVSKAG